MVTAHELAEAQAYARRRLVTAFVSGATPEQIGDPRGAGRPLLAGLALAVLLVAGVAIRSLIG